MLWIRGVKPISEPLELSRKQTMLHEVATRHVMRTQGLTEPRHWFYRNMRQNYLDARNCIRFGTERQKRASDGAAIEGASDGLSEASKAVSKSGVIFDL